MLKKTISIYFLAIFVVGCAAPTKYQPLSHTGGYTDKRQTYVDENIYEVAFHGNGFTSRSRAEELALLRAAEVTLEDGYAYFIILDGDSYVFSSTITTPSSYQSTTNLYSYGNTTTAKTITQQTGGGTYTSHQPSHRIKIAAFESKVEANKHDSIAYSSQKVRAELSRRYGIGEKNSTKN